MIRLLLTPKKHKEMKKHTVITTLIVLLLAAVGTVKAQTLVDGLTANPPDATSSASPTKTDNAA